MTGRPVLGKFKNNKYMSTKDFEKAIDALGVQGLEIVRFSYQINGGISSAYGKTGDLTWLKWDAVGRGFRFDQPRDMEGCISSANVMYLDYRRDVCLDLKFE